MQTSEQCRAFARKCIRWAEKAKDIKHREILLDMARVLGGDRRPDGVPAFTVGRVQQLHRPS
jgi:hypothetical protein